MDEGLKNEIGNFVRLLSRYGYGLTGFLFRSDPPMIVHFGNVTEKGPGLTELHLRLCDLADESLTAGNIIQINLEEKNDDV